MPKRIQRKRTKGWHMPDGAIYVGRPTKWGNPFRGPAAVVIFRHNLRLRLMLGTLDLSPLRGKDLACWCPLPKEGEPDQCHAAVLLEIANR